MSDRQTISSVAEITHDPEQRAALEAENALLQFDRVLDLIDEAVRDGKAFRLRPSTILTLHAEAIRGLHSQAGTFRNAGVEIAGSLHQPPAEHLVAVAVEDMCDWVNTQWSQQSAVELCSYVMWKLNWIHPFADGNGRTTRAVAYLVLCIRANARLPGAPTIPEQIAEDKPPYYDASEAADASERIDEPNLAPMTDLLRRYLAKQLEGVLASATSTDIPDKNARKFH